MKELIELLTLLFKKCHEFENNIEVADTANHLTQLLATQASHKQPYLDTVLDNLSVVLSQPYKLTYQDFHHEGNQFITSLVTLNENKENLRAANQEIAQRVKQEIGEKYQNLLSPAHLYNYIDVNIDLESLNNFVERSKQRSQWLAEIIASISDVSIFQKKANRAFTHELSSLGEIETAIQSDQIEIKNSIKHLNDRLDDKHIWEEIIKSVDIKKDITLKVWQETRDHLGIQSSENSLYDEFSNLFSDFGFEEKLKTCFCDKKAILQLFDDYNEMVGIVRRIKQILKNIADEFNLDKIAESLQEALEKKFFIVATLRERYQPLKEKFERVLEGRFKGIDEALSQLECTLTQNRLQLEKKIHEISDKLNGICALKDKRELIDNAIQRFSFKQYESVKGDFFDYIKQVHFKMGDAAALLKKLKEHGKNHKYKSAEINYFIQSLSQASNLAEWRKCYEAAIKNEALMQSTTPWGKKLDKKFDIKSTTADLIRALHQQFDLFIEREHQTGMISLSMQRHEDDRVASYFNNKGAVNCLDLVNAICEQLTSFLHLEELTGFNESLFHIAMWDTKDAGARYARLATLMDEMHQDIVNKIVKGHVDLHDLRKTLYELKDQYALNITEVQKNYPFSYRYEVLRFQLSKVNTNRSCQSLWRALDDLAKSDDVDEYLLMRVMGEKLESFYCKIRQSRLGSVNFFGQGSRLGDAIEDFLRSRKGFYLNDNKISHCMEVPSSLFKCMGF